MKIFEGKRPLLVSLALATLYKFYLLSINAFTFNGDEAVVALMARHILRGARPAFFYGQNYMGSIDAYLIAGAFSIFGEKVWVIRLVQTILYLMYIVTLWWLAQLFFKDKTKPIFVVFLCIVPPLLVTTYSTMTLGGYGESLIFGNLILVFAYLLIFGGKQKETWIWVLLGFIAGTAFWTLGIAGGYILPIALIGLWKFDRRLIKFYLLSGLSFILGSLPWWLNNFNNEWGAWKALSGTFTNPSTILEQIQSTILFGFPSLLGMRFPWSPEYFPLPIVLITTLLFITVFLFTIDQIKKKELFKNEGARILFVFFVISFLILIILSPYGIEITGRYLLPLFMPLVFASASLIAKVYNYKKLFGYLLLGTFLGFNLYGSILAVKSPDKITTQFVESSKFDNSYDNELIEFLTENGEIRGYTNYWVTFRLAFLTNEIIIFAAYLPYKENLSYAPMNNRYPQYSEMVDASEKVAYITTKHLQLNERLREEFDTFEINYLEKEIGPYQVFYQLSEPIRPEEIGFGEAKP